MDQRQILHQQSTGRMVHPGSRPEAVFHIRLHQGYRPVVQWFHGHVQYGCRHYLDIHLRFHSSNVLHPFASHCRLPVHRFQTLVRCAIRTHFALVVKGQPPLASRNVERVRLRCRRRGNRRRFKTIGRIGFQAGYQRSKKGLVVQNCRHGRNLLGIRKSVGIFIRLRLLSLQTKQTTRSIICEKHRLIE